MPACRIYWLETIASARRIAASPKNNVVRESLITDLPDQQPTRLEPIVNAKSAKAPGLTIPQSTLARAYKVCK